MLDLVVDRRELKAAIARALRFGRRSRRTARPGAGHPRRRCEPGPIPPGADPSTSLGAGRPGIDFLFSLERFGMKFGLANIARLCAALGHPEARVPVGHRRRHQRQGIGHRDGRHSAARRGTSQRALHLAPPGAGIEERFVIDGREVTPDALEAAALLVQRTAQALVAAGELETLPTFFECTTAAAFVLFRDAKVDIAVLEVGLGGRLDATNIVSPVAAAIVSIDVDHEAQLGTSVTAIAGEKAGSSSPASRSFAVRCRERRLPWSSASARSGTPG